MDPTAGEGTGGSLGLTGGSVLSPAGIVSRSDVLIEGGRVAAVGPGVVPASCDRVVPLDGAVVAPGLIDLHVHGYAGVSPLTADGDGLRRMDGALARAGVTGYLVAFSAAPFDAVAAACERLAVPGAAPGCLGVQLEGTFVNPAAAGAQDAAAMVRPGSRGAARWLDLPGLRAVVVAPELPGGLELVRAAASRGLIVSVGHTLADGPTIGAARDAGASLITHFLNNGGAPSWKAREPGLLGAGLLDPSWWLEVIADGVHVHPDNLELLRRCRGTHRICIVSDTRSAAGMPDGRRLLGDGIPVTREGSRLVTDGGAIAGGAEALGTAVSGALARGEPAVPLLAMAAANPARLLGIHPDAGAIGRGSRADLTAWSAEGGLRLVVAAGRPVTG